THSQELADRRRRWARDDCPTRAIPMLSQRLEMRGRCRGIADRPDVVFRDYGHAGENVVARSVRTRNQVKVWRARLTACGVRCQQTDGNGCGDWKRHGTPSRFDVPSIDRSAEGYRKQNWEATDVLEVLQIRSP